VELQRYEKNPILRPVKSNQWESEAVFNCGAIYWNNQVHLLYRAIGEYDNYISRIGYAISSDGINFQRKNSPLFELEKEYEKWGCEDPRITEIEGKFYITYVVLSQPARQGGGLPRTALATTTDFIHFEKKGIITPEGADDKDAVLFPEKINGEYVMLHRPHNWIQKDVYEEKGKKYLRVKEKVIEWPIEEIPNYFPEKPSIWISYSKNLKNWIRHKVLMEPKEWWEDFKIGAGTPPIKTKKGWLIIYHGVSSDGYRAGATLLDLKNPSKVIGKTKNPILEPKEDYEKTGDVNNVVFPTGGVIINNKLFIYYGTADKYIGLATCDLEKLLKELTTDFNKY